MIRETPKASDTKPGVETRSAAELIALGRVRIQRMRFGSRGRKIKMGNPRVKFLPLVMMSETWNSLNDRTGVGRQGRSHPPEPA